MSTVALGSAVKTIDWALWKRQVTGIIALEAKRSFFGRRSFFIYLLALAPVFILALRLIVPTGGGEERFFESVGGANGVFAIMYRTFFLRLAVFFGCVGVFTRVIRGDILERTLHYYLLQPLRREVLVAGKYLAGLLSTSVIFGASTMLSYVMLFLPGGWSSTVDYLLSGSGLGILAAYIGLTVLACIGYGSVFLLIGLFFGNPIIPAAVVLGWESINFLLPPLLKEFSVIYYLESLCPVPIPEGPVTILAEPAPFWMAVPGLLLVTALALVIAGLKVRRMEITYGDD